MSDSNLKNEDDFDETILAESEDSMQDVDEVFKQYDENSDGRIDHSEYVAKHKTEVGSGGISAFMDRILDDEPALRGQRNASRSRPPVPVRDRTPLHFPVLRGERRRMQSVSGGWSGPHPAPPFH